MPSVAAGVDDDEPVGRVEHNRVSIRAAAGEEAAGQEVDAVGDFAEHRGRPRRGQEQLRIKWPDPEAVDVSTAVALLDDFADHCEAVGARCVFAYAPFPRPESEAGWATPRRG